MKHKNNLGKIAVVLCILSLAGCGTSENTTNETNVHNTDNTNTTAEESKKSMSGNPADSNDADSLLIFASANGTVTSFSDDSCTISPVRYSGDNIAYTDAPGNENPDSIVTIHYQSDCVFKIAKISIVTGTVTYSDADISDIKKQTSLIIYGDWSNEKNIDATRVFIARYE